jgi:Na+-transporting methylmalonyl-CoA/oxaloacetate decarboxylase gamma subunit
MVRFVIEREDVIDSRTTGYLVGVGVVLAFLSLIYCG